MKANLTASTQRCAIYTRKSTEAGLDRDVNSLQAQRETCSAYVRSQRHKGWSELPQHYDDGGFSGGNLQRPALQRLLADIEGARVDVVIIYKIDRLTRSLLDFVRLLDTMQRFDVSFVSITQSFDTTDSMGRLILNVLLTFAQFERELIGDRLRDKFAVMKRRGKWVGGREPFGYQKSGRRLVVDEEEAAIVRSVYDRYPLYPSGNQLLRALQAEGVRNKTRVAANGKIEGGRLFAEGILHRILTNPIYLGKIDYKGEWFEGEHDAIISQAQWDCVQALRKERHGEQIPRRPIGNLLLGILYDDQGRRMDVTSVIQNGKRFRYYVTRRDRDPQRERLKQVRAEAGEIERVAASSLRTFLCDRPAIGDALSNLGVHDGDMDRAAGGGPLAAARIAKLRDGALRHLFAAIFKRAEVGRDRLRLIISCPELNRLLTWDGVGIFKIGARGSTRSGTRVHVVDVPVSLVREAKTSSLPLIPRHPSERLPPNTRLIDVIERGRDAQALIFANRDKAVADLARESGWSPTRFARLVKLNYLAPDIVAAILDGRHPPHLTVTKLLKSSIPLDWAIQRQLLGFEAQHDVGAPLIRQNDWRRWNRSYGYDAPPARRVGD